MSLSLYNRDFLILHDCIHDVYIENNPNDSVEDSWEWLMGQIGHGGKKKVML